MPTPNEKLVSALKELRELQADGSRVFMSSQLSRVAKERLLKHGFLQEVMRGWVTSANHTSRDGDTTPWFASFWEFCRRYCDERFRKAWHLAADRSLLLHAENTVVPKQLIIHSPDANNNRIDLPFGCSLFALKQKKMPDPGELDAYQGLPVFRVEAALTRVSEDFFSRHAVEAAIALSSIRDPSALLSRLLDGGHSVIAGRLAGAFRRIGLATVADEIVSAMKSADYDVRETDPFADNPVPAITVRSAPPIVTRLQTLWASARDGVLAVFPNELRLSIDPAAYLQLVDGVYRLDAYHSLSIEGYQVTPELIQRVSTGAWDPDHDGKDRDDANALAARGYWQAFVRVREVVSKILESGGDVDVLRSAHRDWYRELFNPHVAAGLLTPSTLAGYRNQPVYIRGSWHVPPRFDVIKDAMPALFELIEAEPEASVRAVLGHWLFGYVHPFPDGNGRIARFIMNALFAAGGYPWTVIRIQERGEYLATLEKASVENDVRPFASFIARQLKRTSEHMSTAAS